MKISQLDIAISEDYDNFAEKMIETITNNFYGIGYNSISMTKFLSYLRKEFYLYAKVKFNKDVLIKVIFPSVKKRFIEKTIIDRKEEISLKITSEKIKDILNAQDTEFEDIIYDLVNQFESYINNDKSKDYRKYLISQIEGLSSICSNELKLEYSKEMIKRNLIKPEGWRRLSKKSSIFNDYYNLFNQDKEKFEKIFMHFLKNILKDIDK